MGVDLWGRGGRDEGGMRRRVGVARRGEGGEKEAGAG